MSRRGSGPAGPGEDEVRDERFAAFLRRAAADYHRPPETPREAMWAEIAARLEAGREPGRAEGGADASSDEGTLRAPVLGPALAEAAEAYHAPPETPREALWARIEPDWRARDSAGAAPRARQRPRRMPRWVWGVGLAATLALGIAIGRQSVTELERDAVGDGVAVLDGRPVGAEPVGAGPAGEGPAAPPEEAAEPGAERPVDATEPATEDGRLATGPGRVAGDGAARPAGDAGRRAADEGAAGAPGGTGGTGTAEPAGSGSLGYRMAAAEHLLRTETLLVSFQAAAEATDDEELARWAGDLLADTRLLMDWPGERDPRLAALLEELELVLVQIVQVAEGRAGEEREWVVEGLEERDVLPRLRAGIPVSTT